MRVYECLWSWNSDPFFHTIGDSMDLFIARAIATFFSPTPYSLFPTSYFQHRSILWNNPEKWIPPYPSANSNIESH